MATRQDGRIVETTTEARQAEPGPSVLALLTASTGLAVLILGIVGSSSSGPDGPGRGWRPSPRHARQPATRRCRMNKK